MTENSTAIVEQQPQRPRPPAVQSGGSLSAFVPTDIDQAFRIARAIAMSGMAPKSYGNDENKCFVGIMAGAELGLMPFQALQSIAVIGGNPSVWGDGALALVRASGLLEEFEESDDGHEATCRVVRKGEKPIVNTFSMDDAKKAGLSGKAGPWTQYPKRMRKMRARAFSLRDAFADVLKGLHIAEEVRDRPDLMEDQANKPQRLSSAMLAQQAGATVEQDDLPPLTERDVGRHDDQLDRLVEAEDVQDAEIEEVAEAEAAALSEAAEQALDDIDGPLDDDQADDGPDPREAVAAELIAKVDKCETVIDLRGLHDREKATIEALPDELATKVTDAFNVMREALKRRAAQ
jgi:hypothetical protein